MANHDLPWLLEAVHGSKVVVEPCVLRRVYAEVMLRGDVRNVYRTDVVTVPEHAIAVWAGWPGSQQVYTLSKICVQVRQ